MANDSRTAQNGTQKVREPNATVVWNDAQLLRQFLSQSDETAEAAFTTLIERHGPIVYRVCFDILRTPEEAQDAAQAVFLVLAIKAGSIRKPEALGPWLHGVSLRLARRVRQELARRRAAERKQAEMKHQRFVVEPEPDGCEFTELHEEVDRLPEKYRQPIILCYLQGLTQAEAAEALGWPLGTVQIRLHRGREKLRSQLSRRNSASQYLGSAALLAMMATPRDLPGLEWTESTAQAAMRFSTGELTAGLVAPDVTCMAESMLSNMARHRWKPAVLTALAVPLIAMMIWLGSIATTKHNATDAATRAPVPEKRIVAAVQEVAPEKTPPPVPPIAPPSKPREPLADQQEQQQPERTSPGLILAEANPKPEPQPINGRELFERVWSKDDTRGHGGDGLGPVFNASSCAACHHSGGIGGAGGVERNIEIATLADPTPDANDNGYFYSFSMDFGAGKFEYRFGDPSTPNTNTRTRPELRVDPTLLAAIHPGFRESRSVVLHRFGTDPDYNAWRGSVPGRHGMIQVRLSQRNTPPLFGAGLIDAIPDSVIEATAKRKTATRGRVSRLKDGRIGRFGWKSQTATLKEFVLSAAAGEMGLEVPTRHQAADPRLPGIEAKAFDMDQAECDSLTEFVRKLPTPIRNEPRDDQDASQIKLGEETFKTIGCAQCHIPKLGNVDGIYSDLLLHEMSPRLADSENYAIFVGAAAVPNRAEAPDRGKANANSGPATSQEWRTPPLWGLRDSAPYLHDGRALTIDEAIALHAGQGASAAKKFAELSPKRKRNLAGFLNTLAAPRANN